MGRFQICDSGSLDGDELTASFLGLLPDHFWGDSRSEALRIKSSRGNGKCQSSLSSHPRGQSSRGRCNGGAGLCSGLQTKGSLPCQVLEFDIEEYKAMRLGGVAKAGSRDIREGRSYKAGSDAGRQVRRRNGSTRILFLLRALLSLWVRLWPLPIATLTNEKGRHDTY